MFLNGVRFTVKCLKCTNPTRVVQMRINSDLKKYNTHARQPSKILNEEEILHHIEPAEGPNQYLDSDKERKQLKIKPKKSNFKKKFSVTLSDVRLKEDGKLNYLELKETDTTLTTLMMQVRSRKSRDRNSRIILEGHRLIADAIESGAIPEIIVFSRVTDALKLPLPERGVKFYKVPYRAIQTWSTLTTAPGVMGFFKIPETEITIPSPDALPLTIICDNIREPGNMGSIMRAAAGVGCKKLILMKGCVDIWDSKVLRSATGAHFRFPIYATKTWNDVRHMIDPDSNIYIADNNITERIVKPQENEETESKLLAGEETSEYDDQDDNEVDEDNIDAKHKDKSLKIINEDELFESVKNSDKHKNYQQRMQDTKIAKELTGNIPVIPYYSSDYTTGETVIVIGGETTGLSLEALALVRDKNGVRVNIPMTNGVDSLNTGMALGIIAFEIKKQFSIKAPINTSE